MITLGINSFFEHPSVAFIEDGDVLFAAEDERFTGIKHGKRYSPYSTYVPWHSMYAGLKSLNITSARIDEVAFSYSPSLHLASLGGCLRGRRFSPLYDEIAAFFSAVHVKRALRSPEATTARFSPTLNPKDFADTPVRFWDHHLCHAASAYFCSGDEEALIVVADGAGENACTSVFVGRDGRITKLHEETLPSSLGHFYSSVTAFLGFQPFSDEFKVMGMSGYGSPVYRDQLSEVLQIKAGGGYGVDPRKVRSLDRILGKPRAHGDPFSQFHFDVAKSAQVVFEDAIVHVLRYWRDRTRIRRLNLAGGCFLNCLANGRIAREGLFESIFVQPASSDAGTALGAAALSAQRHRRGRVSFRTAFLGTAYDDDAIRSVLESAGVMYERLTEDEQLARLVDRLMAGGICALFRGRMEFGPRSLGNRCLLSNPALESARETLNEVKNREQFRPVAPMVTSEAFDAYFDGEKNEFMMITSDVRPDKRALIPSAVHVDGTARVQLVTEESQPFIHRLLNLFAERSGHPVLINTSFNIAGRPIVERPLDALAAFMTSRIDSLLMGNFLVEKPIDP